jgi:hypothetical protein
VAAPWGAGDAGWAAGQGARPALETVSVWVFGLVFGVAVALASPAVPVVTGHAVVGPEQELFQPTRFEPDQMDAASAATSTGPSTHRGGRVVAPLAAPGRGLCRGWGRRGGAARRDGVRAARLLPGCVAAWRYVVRRASVGARRAARMAGYSPASAPSASATPTPPATPDRGTTTCQCFWVA